MSFQTNIHLTYYNASPPAGILPGLAAELDARREALEQQIKAREPLAGLGEADTAWLGRSYPILAVLAPVMSTHEEKIEFPGDPMCLYAALSFAVDQVVCTRALGLVAGAPYNDLCPQWGVLPGAEYRRGVDENGIRQYDGALLNTDQTVFDPRVWNERVRAYFVHYVLEKMRPKVVLISAVSPAHRYAIDIARTVKRVLPDCIVVLGGRHADETMHYNPLAGRLDLELSGPLRLMQEGEIEPVFDLVSAGEGYFSLDVLLKAISLAMDVETRAVSVAGIVHALAHFAPVLGAPFGHALIAALSPGQVDYFPISGPRTVLRSLPSPYHAFAIRAKFPIFEREGRVLRTAHFMVTNACPFHCFFCSEGSAVVGEFISFGDEGIDNAIGRVLEYLDYGAEAIFFDDSIFWGGNVGLIVNFCRAWLDVRREAQHSPDGKVTRNGRTVNARAILNLVWGAQFTVDFLASRSRPEEALLVLETMRAAGCTYFYMGIESMSEQVIQHVHKNLNRRERWDERVRRALGLARMAGLQVGSSVLFGLEGETQQTIAETIDKVEELLAEDLLYIASPNILTYHPNTEITHRHQMEGKLDFHSANHENRPPYTYFEEAFPAVVSKNLTEEDIWTIHRQTQARWGVKRNLNPMPATVLPEE